MKRFIVALSSLMVLMAVLCMAFACTPAEPVINYNENVDHVIKNCPDSKRITPEQMVDIAFSYSNMLKQSNMPKDMICRVKGFSSMVDTYAVGTHCLFTISTLQSEYGNGNSCALSYYEDGVLIETVKNVNDFEAFLTKHEGYIKPSPTQKPQLTATPDVTSTPDATVNP